MMFINYEGKRVFKYVRFGDFRAKNVLNVASLYRVVLKHNVIMGVLDKFCQ
jgi:hypothetical protein